MAENEKGTEEKTPEDKDRDERIARAVAVKALRNHTGFEILKAEWLKIKDEVFAGLVDEKLSGVDISLMQKLYNRVCLWIDIPQTIIKEGEDAIAEGTEPEQPEHPTKRSILGIGRRY